MKKLSIFTEIPQEKLFLFAVDGAKHPKWEAFEEEEPGRIAAVLNGFALIIKFVLNNPQKELSLDLILELHKAATTGVRLPQDIIPGEIRACGVRYDLLLNQFEPDGLGNLSDNGIEELYPLYEAEPLRFSFGKKNDLLTLEKFKTMFYKGPVSFFGYGDAELFMANKDWFMGSLVAEIDAVILKYNTEITDSQNKLLLIVETIQKLEQIHPFADGNYRTFCILLLNYLLLTNDFSPVILHDPNRFDGYAVNELMEECKQGFETVAQLQIKGINLLPEEQIGINLSFFKQNRPLQYAKNLIDAIQLIKDKEDLALAAAQFK